MSTPTTLQIVWLLAWLEEFWCSHYTHWNVHNPKKTTTEPFFILDWFGWSFWTFLMPVPPHSLWIWNEINISKLVTGRWTRPRVGDRQFITELSVSIKLSLLLWQRHYSSGLGPAKQRLLSCSHLRLPIDRCSPHYRHRGYLHDTGAPRMLMMLLSATRMPVSWGGERESEGGSQTREKRGDKERLYAETLQRVKV